MTDQEEARQAAEARKAKAIAAVKAIHAMIREIRPNQQTTYLLTRAIDGLYTVIGEEEARLSALRKNP